MWHRGGLHDSLQVLLDKDIGFAKEKTSAEHDRDGLPTSVGRSTRGKFYGIFP